ncbi:MAG: TetR/AcrR family transcriptional regulator [Chloroflexaceae bacterium]|jgi:AcrR family transcriptional regulator|nr:TetR/AcrR family transcriptional regulator [Chloroflexaceae bacterium]
MRKALSQKDRRKMPSQERSRFTVEAILDAAVQVFERHGYAAGTTARIAERAGVSVGSLYQYFPNKDAILVALVDQHLAEVQTLAGVVFARAHAADLTLPQALRVIVAGFVDMHALNPQLHRLLSEEVVLPGEAQEKLARLKQSIVEAVGQLLARYGVAEQGSPGLTAYVLVQVADHLTHQLVLHPPVPLTPQQCVDEILLVVLGYLGQTNPFTPPPASPAPPPKECPPADAAETAAR